MKAIYISAIILLPTFGPTAIAQKAKTTRLKKTGKPLAIPDENPTVPIQATYFIIKVGNDLYGYDVYVDGNLLIHQTSIPSITGNAGFKDTLSAGTIARLVVKKIEQGEIPPTITSTDLKKNHVVE